MANFEVVNDNNVLQIGDSWRNLEFRQKFGVNPSPVTRPGQADGGQFEFTVWGQNPLVAFAGTNNAILTERVQNGNQFTFKGHTVQRGGFTVYVFDLPGQDGGGQYLLVKDAADQVVFDASRKYMRVVAMLNGTLNPGAAGPAVDVGGGKTVAVLQGVNGGFLQVIGGFIGMGPDWRTETLNYRIVTNTSGSRAESAALAFSRVSNQMQTPNQPIYPSPGNYGRAYVFAAVLDVTGY